MQFPIIIWVAVFLGIAAEFWRTFESQKTDFAVSNETLTFGSFVSGNIKGIIAVLIVYVSGMTGAGFADVMPNANLLAALPAFITGQGLWALTKVFGRGKARKTLNQINDVKSDVADRKIK